MSVMLRAQRRTLRPAGSPLKWAAGISLVYMVFCGCYIVLSGKLAASLTATTEQLAAIERWKGIGFVIVTGLIFFAISLARGRLFEKQQETIARQQASLLLSERREVAAMCAATLAHDLNNLLMSLSGLVDGLRDKAAGDACLAGMHAELEKNIANLSQLARRVASSARQGLPAAEGKAELRETVQRLGALVRRHPDLTTAVVTIRDCPTISVHVNTVLLEEAVLNLLVNAGQAAGQNGKIQVRIRDEEQAAFLEVHDSGPGIPENQVESIFQPCFTTKPEGTGLGLLAVQAFADSCAGDVQVGRSDLGGAVFSIRIPKATTRPR